MISGFDDDFSDGATPGRSDDDAIRRFRRMLDSGADDITIPNVEVLEEFVEQCLEEERFADALRACDHWIRHAPYSHNAWLARGIALTNLMRAEEALICFDRADVLNPRDIDTLINRGVALDALGLSDRALTCYQDALDREPDNEEALFNKAVALEKLEDYESAVLLFRTLVFSEQFGRDSWYELGYCYDYLDRLDESFAAYDRFLDLDPFNSNAWYNRGIILSRKGHHQKAI